MGLILSKMNAFKKNLIRCLGLATCLMLAISAQKPKLKNKTSPQPISIQDTVPNEDTWIDSVMASMTIDEKIGQLFMIRAHSNLGADHIRKVEEQIKKYHVGGLCFFQGTAKKQVELTNKYQSISKIPLMISMDGEWGLAMRLSDSVVMYPRNLMLGAIHDHKVIYEYGRAHAAQFKRIGVHVNFGPVLDINNNPRNPVINDRSFGEDKFNVTVKGYMYTIGLQDEGIMACGKHFPGHGDTEVDSHHDLPVIRHNRTRLEEVELFPFEILCENGLQSLMVAHVWVPALDPTPNLPASLSKSIIDTLLRQRMSYDGLVFTDALEMKGVTKFFKPGDIELKALQAGNDILLLPEDIGKAFQTIKSALLQNEISERRIDESLRRILRAKYRLGLYQKPEPISLENLYQDLNQPEFHIIKEHVMAEALTLVRDSAQIMPLQPSPGQQVVFFHLNADSISHFEKTVYWYAKAKHHLIRPNTSKSIWQNLFQKITPNDFVVVSIHAKKRVASANYGIEKYHLEFLESLERTIRKKPVLILFGNPYGLQFFDAYPTIVAAYEDDPLAHRLSMETVFGARSFVGQLPVNVSPNAKLSSRTATQLNGTLRFTMTEAVGMNAAISGKLDSLADEMIKVKAAPGCQLLVIKDNAVLIHKSYGNHLYDPKSPAVENHHLYDIASITKVAAATLAIMKLYEEKLVDLDAPIGRYLDFVKKTDLENITLKQILLHKAGLTPWIAFYKKTVEKKNGHGMVIQDTGIYSTVAKKDYLPVAENLYIRADYLDTMLDKIVKYPLSPDQGYKYSDLGFILIPYIVQNISGQNFETYLNKHFYEPMGLNHTLFNPREKGIPLSQIVPTEQDSYFRNQLIHGYVHDMAAAMFGGVSGHAGLFSNVRDLGILFTMLVNEGFYQGRRYLKPETVRYFTSRPTGESRRGLGFDMAQLDPGKSVNVTKLASGRTFGHTGFTGTCVWADPECGVIFVFLSNRVHPSMDNNKLNDHQYRLRAHYQIYKSLE